MAAATAANFPSKIRNDDMTNSFGLIGCGWRAEFYLRIARELPGQFPIAGVVVRNAGKRARLAARWAVPVFATLDELLSNGKPSFVVTSVPWAANLPLLETFASRDLPVLSETPIAPELPDLCRCYELVRAGARIQVAEQYLFQPAHAARLGLIRSGALGEIHEATVSFAHGYHGLSLLQRYLGVELQYPRIRARKFASRIVAGPGREGPPTELSIVPSERIIAELDYGDSLGIYDFTGDQYFSWIRSPQLLVRGEKGEINQSNVRILKEFNIPINFALVRDDTGHEGNLEGYSHRAIIGGGELLYQNPFPSARFSDDEIAVATSLLKMQNFVKTGESFYSAAEACHDRYLDILVSEAVESGQTVEARIQPWSSRD